MEFLILLAAEPNFMIWLGETWHFFVIGAGGLYALWKAKEPLSAILHPWTRTKKFQDIQKRQEAVETQIDGLSDGIFKKLDEMTRQMEKLATSLENHEKICGDERTRTTRTLEKIDASLKKGAALTRELDKEWRDKESKVKERLAVLESKQQDK